MALSGLVGRESIWGPGHPNYDAMESYRAGNDQKLNSLYRRVSPPMGPPAQDVAREINRRAVAQAASNAVRGKAGLDPIYNPGALGPGYAGNNQGGFLGQIQTGINAGQDAGGQLQSFRRRLGVDSAPGVPMPDGGAAVQQQFQDQYGPAIEAGNLGLSRNQSYEQGRLDLSRQRAQSGAGLDWMNLLARLNELQLGQNTFNQGTIYDLISGLGG